MELKLRNFGKIASADVNLDGITVICGNNNTGKSTIGKALFSFFNSLYDYKSRINLQKQSAIENFIFKNTNVMDLTISDFGSTFTMNNIISFVENHSGEYKDGEVKAFLEKNYPLKIGKNDYIELVNALNASDLDILNLSVFRYFTNVMNGQIKNVNVREQCSVEGIFKGNTRCKVKLFKNRANCILGEYIQHCAYYINTPFIVDSLNDDMIPMSSMERSVVRAIINAQKAINKDSMAGALDSIVNAKELDDIRATIKKAYSGDTVIEHGKYYYIENGISFDFKNLSAGLKSFAIIERLLETGALKKKDVLILDEPEIHLHSEWQIIYAELIVLLQKKFDLTILLVTHSFQFLESLNFFMKKYDTWKHGNYYIPENTDKGVVMKSYTDNLSELKKNLKSGMYTLADLQLDELDNGDSDEEDNE